MEHVRSIARIYRDYLRVGLLAGLLSAFLFLAADFAQARSLLGTVTTTLVSLCALAWIAYPLRMPGFLSSPRADALRFVILKYYSVPSLVVLSGLLVAASMFFDVAFRGWKLDAPAPTHVAVASSTAEHYSLGPPPVNPFRLPLSDRESAAIREEGWIDWAEAGLELARFLVDQGRVTEAEAVLVRVERSLRDDRNVLSSQRREISELRRDLMAQKELIEYEESLDRDLKAIERALANNRYVEAQKLALELLRRPGTPPSVAERARFLLSLAKLDAIEDALASDNYVEAKRLSRELLQEPGTPPFVAEEARGLLRYANHRIEQALREAGENKRPTPLLPLEEQ